MFQPLPPITGPHIPSTGAIKALAVTKNSSSYWQGRADQQTLQRVYGIAFPKASMLKVCWPGGGLLEEALVQ